MIFADHHRQDAKAGQATGADAVRQAFLQEGFLVVPDLIDAELVADIRKSITAAEFKEQDPLFGDKRKDKRLNQGDQACPWLSLLTERIAPFTELLLGPQKDNVVDVQYSVIEAGRLGSPGWHIDGSWIAQKEHSVASIPFFKLLVGVYLSDLTSNDRGNFMYLPGGHHSVARFFDTIGAEVLAEQGVDEVFKALGRIELGQLHQLLVKPGDVIFAHALLPHSIATNNFETRPALYLRIGEYQEKGLSALSKIGHEFCF